MCIMGAAVKPTDEYPWWKDVTDYLFWNSNLYYPDYEDLCDLSWDTHFKPVFIPVMYSVAFVLGILGNALLLKVLLKSRKIWMVTDTFILHLAVANILLLATLPLWAAQSASAGGWVFGTLLCQITGSVFTINLYSGIFLLVCISVVYYLSIICSTGRFMRRNPWVVHACCAVVWLFSLLLSIPDWISLEVSIDDRQNKRWCVQKFSKFSEDIEEITTLQMGLKWLNIAVGFLLPSAVLILCFSCILLHLQCSSPSPQRQQAFKIISALTVLFFLCWAPYIITLMLVTFHQPTACADIQILNTALTITYILGYFHCSLNPILFVLVDVKFWRQVRNMWGKKSHRSVF